MGSNKKHKGKSNFPHRHPAGRYETGTTSPTRPRQPPYNARESRIHRAPKPERLFAKPRSHIDPQHPSRWRLHSLPPHARQPDLPRPLQH
ncbi:hypothetical protein B0T17DRAFT_129024 [Bombardia bombarda]|uniref:Uncharacterized protein n=1 Tax=Bombardia bombarda TaxID=252184 RepID=A0AA39U2C4_9PEZI|nr:hypothetical protein B0T17DRAFT_129024 [Bombardia bombarda]